MTPTAPLRAASADGCRAGWIGLSRIPGETVSAWLCASADELVSQLEALEPQPDVLLIDMPIGLPQQGGRSCDQAARERLGARRSSIFPAPIRPVLAAGSWEEACAIREQLEGKRMSKQSWNITAKVREVDALLQARPELRGWLREVHPELSFSTLAGAPLPHPKKTPSGKQLRQALIAATFGAGAYEAVRAQFRRTAVANDDILDAFAALWSAERLLNGLAAVLPTTPEHDATGLSMEIVV